LIPGTKEPRHSPGGSGAWLQKCSLDTAPCVYDKWFIFLQFLSFQNINGSGSHAFQPAFTEPRDLKKRKNRETSSNWYLIYTRGFYLVHVFFKNNSKKTNASVSGIFKLFRTLFKFINRQVILSSIRATKSLSRIQENKMF